MKNFVYQGDEDSCGLAVLKMLLLELTKKKGYRYLAVEKDNPLSLEDIRKAAFQEGVDISWKRCQKKEDLNAYGTLPLLIVQENEGKSHLVLLKKANKKKFLVYDPAIGPKWIKKEKVVESFSCVYGEAMLFSVENCPYNKPKIIKKRSLMFTGLITLLGVAFLYLGLSFMGDEKTYPFVILFLAIYGLCNIGSRMVNDYYSKKFDKKWLKYVPSTTKKQLLKNYERYYAFKAEVFPVLINLLESVSVIVGLNFLYGLNDLYFFVSAFGLGLYLLIESHVYRSGLSKQKEALVIDESNLLECRDSKQAQLKKMKAIGSKANEIGASMTYMRIVYFAVAACFAFIPPFMSDNLSLNYYLFHLFGLLAIGQGMRSLLNFFETKCQREKAYSYFIETFVKKESSR